MRGRITFQVTRVLTAVAMARLPRTAQARVPPVTPGSPLASGVLSGKYSREVRSVAGSSRSGYAAPQLTESTFVLLDALAEIAGEHRATVAAVALAWVRQRSEVTSTLIGGRTIDQLDANLASAEVILA